MANKYRLQDPKDVKSKLDSFFKDNKTPTLAGLMLALGLRSMYIVHDYMERESDIAEQTEISELITDAYIRIVDIHEQRLFGTCCTGSIFWLKSISKCGFNFKEDSSPPNSNKDINITFSVIPNSDYKPVSN